MKVNITYCDRCGKDVSRWITVTTVVEDRVLISDLSDLRKYRGRYELCTECYARIYGELMKKPATV